MRSAWLVPEARKDWIRWEQARRIVEKNGLNFKDVEVIGLEAQELMGLSQQYREVAGRLLNRVGRVDLVDFPGGAPFARTAWPQPTFDRVGFVPRGDWRCVEAGTPARLFPPRREFPLRGGVCP